MVKPQTARRRQRVQQQAQQQHHTQQTQDEIGNMHDEADIMSFRSAATHRFVLNQELIENLTEKWIPLDNLVKPVPFSTVQTTKTDVSEIHDELYFGNISLMKQKMEMLKKDIEELTKDKDSVLDKFGDSKFLLEHVESMSDAYVDKTPLNTDEISTKFTERFKTRIITEPYETKSIPSLRTDNSEAPVNYWEDLKKKREEVDNANSLALNKASDEDIVMNGDYQLGDDGTQGQDQLAGFDQGFATGELDSMIDDVNFGLQPTLDDQDFLSQIDQNIG